MTRIVVGLLVVGCGPKASPAAAVQDAEVVVVTPSPALPVDTPTYESAPEALRNLSFDVLDEADLSGPNQRFGAALRTLVHGSATDAAQQFASLSLDEHEGVRHHARRIRLELHVNGAEYGELAATKAAWGEPLGELEKVLVRLPRPVVETREPIHHGLVRGMEGLPMVDVQANGTEVSWMFDTGAEFTLVAASHGEALGVELLDDDIELGTSTSHEQAARFGVLPRLDVGAVVFRSLPVLVVPDEALRWELDGDVHELKGIVGWNAIRYARTELDFVDGSYAMAVSEPRDDLERNLFWLDTPVVRLQGPGGEPLAFEYDSGSTSTDFSASFLEKADTGRVRRERVSVGGVGGIETRKRRVADTLSIVLAGYRFDVPSAYEDEVDVAFIQLDGRLGSDVAQACRVILDVPNHHYGMQCPGAE